MTAAVMEDRARPRERWSSWAQAHPVLVVALVAGGVRLAVAAVSFVASRYAFPDETSYVALANAVASGKGANSWAPIYGQQLYNSTWGFTAPLALLFKVFGPSRLLGQLLAAGFGVLTAMAVARLALEVLPRRWALAAGLLVGMWPSQVIFSSVVLRESAVWCGIAGVGLAVVMSTRLTGWRLLAPGLLAAVALLFVGTLRTQSLLAACWSAVIVVPFLTRRDWWLRVGAALALALMVPFVLGQGLGGSLLVKAAGSSLGATRTNMGVGAQTEFTSPEAAGSEAEGGLTAPPAYCRDLDRGGALAIACNGARRVRGPDGSGSSLVVGPDGRVYKVEEGLAASVSHLPGGLVATMLRPFPWESSSNLSVAMARLENLGWYLLYGLAACGIVLAGWRQRAALAYPVVVTSMLVVIGALAEGNLGSSFRHRAGLLWAIALLAVVGARQLLERRQPITTTTSPAPTA